MGDTKIKWAKKVWNPFGGCKKVSTGCKNCYAVRLGNGDLRSFYPDGFENGVYFFRHRMNEPRKWRKPQIVFVGSMGDIYQPNMPDSYIDEIYGVMADLPKHTFMILTKYPDRMKAYLLARYKDNPLPNVWVGVSVENQDTANARVGKLISIARANAAIKIFVSYEPAVGLVDFNRIDHMTDTGVPYRLDSLNAGVGRGIDLVIMGGESGVEARPMSPGWVRFVHDQCKKAGVPFFFKQWGEWSSYETAVLSLPHDRILAARSFRTESGDLLYRVGKEFTGDLIGGIQYHEWPQ